MKLSWLKATAHFILHTENPQTAIINQEVLVTVYLYLFAYIYIMTFTSEFTLQPEGKFPGASLQHTDWKFPEVLTL